MKTGPELKRLKRIFTVCALGLLGASSLEARQTIIGNYVDQFNLPVTCVYTAQLNDQGESGLCTGSIFEGRFIITAQHCVDAVVRNGYEKPTLECRGPKGASLSRKVKNIILYDPSPGPSAKDPKAMILSTAKDLALMEIDSKDVPDEFKPSRVRLVSTTQEGNQLLDSKQCLLSGWGVENKPGEIGIPGETVGTLHTVVAPLEKVRGSGGTVELILRMGALLLSDQISEKIARRAVDELHTLMKKADTENPEMVLLGGRAYLRGASVVTNAGQTGLSYAVDGTIVNGSNHGDSGGPMYCVKDEREIVQVGVASSGSQIPFADRRVGESLYALLHEPKVLEWLRKNMQ